MSLSSRDSPGDKPPGTFYSGARYDIVKSTFIGVLLSGITYGIAFMLFIDCFRLFLKRTTLSRRKRWTFITYITALFLVDTAALVLAAVNVNLLRLLTGDGSFSERESPLLFFLPPYIFALWGADGMMIWRCYHLYRCARQYLFVIVLCVVGGIACTSLGLGILFLTIAIRDTITNWEVTLAILPTITTGTNLILACLIATRLLWHQTRTRQLLGATYGSPYTRVVNICVESCLLVVVVNALFVALLVGHPTIGAFLILELLLTHASVISSLLLLRRIAEGTDAITALKTADLPTLYSDDPLNRIQKDTNHSHLSAIVFTRTTASDMS